MMEGRWASNIALVADWPGIGKKGDKMAAYGENRIGPDGQVLYGKQYAGKGTISWVTYYDAGAKRIREPDVTSGGATFVGTVWKQSSDTWRYRAVGSNPDGKRTTADFTIKVSNKGRTHTWSGIVTTEGEEAGHLHDVYHRVSEQREESREVE